MAQILVADDERMLRRVISRVLKRAGYTVVEAENGQEAIDKLKGDPDSFSLAILDMNMPQVDGIVAAKAIFDLKPELPILIASGDTKEAVLERFDGHKPDGVLLKPFVPTELTSVVGSFLK